jgi:hypothetical protein
LATVNVYVPDDLKARLEKANLNLSSFAQAAWEEALMRAALPEDEHVVDAADDDGNPVELRFTGSLIAQSDKTGAELYLTDKDEVLWVEEEGKWGTFPRSEADADDLWDLLRENDAHASACSSLGIKRVVQL